VHFERGQDYCQAVRYLQLAGENAARLSAHQEAMSLLTRGLELLDALRDTPERAQLETALQIPLGGALIATRGFATPEMEKCYARARELCRQVGGTPRLFPALRGLWQFCVLRGVQMARELAEQFLSLAQRVHDPDLLLTLQRASVLRLERQVNALGPGSIHRRFSQGEIGSHCSL
jgi:hypothetical protein